MKKHIALIFLSCTCLLAYHPAIADDELSANRIVDALEGPNKQATRSLTGKAVATPSLSVDDRAFLTELNTRGLKVEKIAKAGSIIDAAKLPSLDIEIEFEFDSPKISKSSADDLKALGAALQHEKLIKAQILLNGHTDAKGDDDYNLTLSQKRADEVMSRLVQDFGIAPERLIAIGFGERRLKDTDDPESATNRRVEVVNIGPLP